MCTEGITCVLKALLRLGTQGTRLLIYRLGCFKVGLVKLVQNNTTNLNSFGINTCCESYGEKHSILFCQCWCPCIQSEQHVNWSPTKEREIVV